MDAKNDELRLISDLRSRLVAQFPNVEPHEVNARVDEAHDAFTDSPVRDFVPMFVERRAVSALTELSG